MSEVVDPSLRIDMFYKRVFGDQIGFAHELIGRKLKVSIKEEHGSIAAITTISSVAARTDADDYGALVVGVQPFCVEMTHRAKPIQLSITQVAALERNSGKEVTQNVTKVDRQLYAINWLAYHVLKNEWTTQPVCQPLPLLFQMHDATMAIFMKQNGFDAPLADLYEKKKMGVSPVLLTVKCQLELLPLS